MRRREEVQLLLAFRSSPKSSHAFGWCQLCSKFFVTLLCSKLWFITKNFFFNYVHFCLFGFTALDGNIDTFLALRVSTPSVVDSSITRVVGLEAGRGKGGVGCS